MPLSVLEGMRLGGWQARADAAGGAREAGQAMEVGHVEWVTFVGTACVCL